MDEELKPFELSRTLIACIRVLRATPAEDEIPVDRVRPGAEGPR